MAQAALVGNEIAAGQKLLGQLTAVHFDVTAAAWVKAGEDGRWLLYIASKVVDERGLIEAYRAIHPVVWGEPDVWLDPFDIRLIGAAAPLTTDLLERQRQYARKAAFHLAGTRLGGMFVDEAYVYPPLSNP